MTHLTSCIFAFRMKLSSLSLHGSCSKSGRGAEDKKKLTRQILALLFICRKRWSLKMCMFHNCVSSHRRKRCFFILCHVRTVPSMSACDTQDQFSLEAVHQPKGTRLLPLHLYDSFPLLDLWLPYDSLLSTPSRSAVAAHSGKQKALVSFVCRRPGSAEKLSLSTPHWGGEALAA